MLPNGQSSIQRTRGKLSLRVAAKAVLRWTWDKRLNLRSLQFPFNIKIKNSVCIPAISFIGARKCPGGGLRRTP